MFINADQLMDVNICQQKIIETVPEILNKVVSLIRKTFSILMACNQLFYARDQMLQFQKNLFGSLSGLLKEIKFYRTAVFCYKLTFSNYSNGFTSKNSS